MLDLKLIRDNSEILKDALVKRGQAEDEVVQLLEMLKSHDTELRQTKTQLQEAQARRNQISKDVGKAKAAKDEEKALALIAEMGDLKERVAAGEAREKELSDELDGILAGIPNLPAGDVPVGDESANKEVRRWGELPKFDFEPKQHFELGEALGLMDFETAAKMSGSRFVVLKGALARMERALAAFMLDLQTGEGGYEEVSPPLLVKDPAMYGTGQLPKFADDLFSTNRASLDDFVARIMKLPSHEIPTPQDLESINYLGLSSRFPEYFAEVDALKKGWPPYRDWFIPTAEVPLTNMVLEDILEEAKLPYRFTAHTPCFRSEAGAAGKDTRGMIRLHQFSKVELVSITGAEQSEAEHERMTNCAEEVLKRLELPYRTIVLSTGDMGFAARKTYDIEVWLPGQDTYREISSCSNCGDFQARRMNSRYRPKDAKELRFVHTLNGSGLAVGRTLVAVLENYQQKDGSIRIPDVLVPYMGGLEVIGA